MFAVPTADTLDPGAAASSVPSFPVPPPTRAEQVRAERDAEDAEDAAAGPEEETGGAARRTKPDRRRRPRAARTAPPWHGPPRPRPPPAPGTPRAETTPRPPGRRTDHGAAGAGPGRGHLRGRRRGGETAAKEERAPPPRATRVPAARRRSPRRRPAAGPRRRTPRSRRRTRGRSGRARRTADGGRGRRRDPGSRTGRVGRRGRADGAGRLDRDPWDAGRRGGRGTGPRDPYGTASPYRVGGAGTRARRREGRTGAREDRHGIARRAGVRAAAGAGPEGGGGSLPGRWRWRRGAPARSKGKKDSAPAPDLSGVSPEAGLATASKLKPHKALQAMGGVGGAVDRSVGDEHKTLASAPPRCSARQARRGRCGASRRRTPRRRTPRTGPRRPGHRSRRTPRSPEPRSPRAGSRRSRPRSPGWDTFKMALGFIGGKIVNGVASLFGADEPVVDPQALAAKFAGLPTKDEALKQARAGDAPGVGMKGAAEQSAGEQDGHVDAKGQATIGTARDDAGRRMGEDQVYPDAPEETMTAKVPGARGGQGAVAGAGAMGAVPPEAASEVAEHDRGPQFQAAFTDGAKSMSEGAGQGPRCARRAGPAPAERRCRDRGEHRVAGPGAREGRG
ncbi:hypothetical protein ACFQ3Z_02010 [Streptomyces nogalater]